MTKNAQEKARPNRVTTNLPPPEVATIDDLVKETGIAKQRIVRTFLLAGLGEYKRHPYPLDHKSESNVDS